MERRQSTRNSNAHYKTNPDTKTNVSDTQTLLCYDSEYQYAIIICFHTVPGCISTACSTMPFTVDMFQANCAEILPLTFDLVLDQIKVTSRLVNW